MCGRKPLPPPRQGQSKDAIITFPAVLVLVFAFFVFILTWLGLALPFFVRTFVDVHRFSR